MAAQFRFVVQAAEAHALELPPHGAGDGLAERRLADARRADEAKQGCLGFGIELQHRQRLENAFLDVVEAEVVLVEHGLRVTEIQRVFGDDVPRQFGHQFQVAARDLIVGGMRGHLRKPLELAVHFFAHVFRQLQVA